MAKVTSIRTEVMFTKNLGNFESLKLGASAELVLEDKDKVATVFKQAYDMCSNEIMLQIAEFEGTVKAKGKK